jgi:outer membrane biosynthesis protein TonB
VRSSNPEFGRAAVEGVRKWQFEPAARDGRKPALRLEVPIMFSANAPAVDKEASVEWGGVRTTRTPRLRESFRPIYPAKMQTAGIKSTVLVEFVVTKRGGVVDAKVIKVTTEPELGGESLREAQLQFGAAALSAVTQWKFLPGLSYGEAVEAEMQIPVSFP